MSNPRFYAGELADNSYTMSETENASYPLANLKTGFSAEQWRSSNANNAQWLKIDLGSAKTIDFVILHNHNINAMTTVKLQYDDADNPAFPTPIDAVANLVTAATGVIDKNEFGAGSPKRYWRILFTTTNGQTPQLGQVFINSKFDPGQPYDLPYIGGNNAYETSEKKSLSGLLRGSQAFGGKTVFEVSFSLAGEAFRTGWITFHNKVRGRLHFFYFANTDDNIYLVKLDKDYNPAETIRYQVNGIATIRMMQQ